MEDAHYRKRSGSGKVLRSTHPPCDGSRGRAQGEQSIYETEDQYQQSADAESQREATDWFDNTSGFKQNERWRCQS
jgi:hypothetical protein